MFHSIRLEKHHIHSDVELSFETRYENNALGSV